MDAVLSGRFIAGLVIGAVLYHLYMMKMAKKGQ